MPTRLHGTKYWSIDLPDSWACKTDVDSTVLSSPDGTATIRISHGVVGHFGDISDAAIGEAARTGGLSSPPTRVRIGDFDGLQAGEMDTDAGRVHHGWWVRAGRLAITIEFRSRSAELSPAVVSAFLSSLRVNRLAVDSHPLERDIAGPAGRAAGMAYVYARRYKYALAFLILAAVFVLFSGRRS